MKKNSNYIIKKIEGEEIKIFAKEISVATSFKVIDDTKGIFEAYVSVFGNVDSYGEIVDKGAFVDWLAKYPGRYPKGVWSHNWDEPIIKTLEISEDDYGLKVKGQFVLAVQRAAEIYALMKEGVITDFSFGYSVLQDEYDPNTGLRHLKKIAIYEYSPVLVGANSEAILQSVKSAKKDGEDAPAPETTPTEDTPADDTPSGDEPKNEDTPAAGDEPAPENGDEPAPTAADDDAGKDDEPSGGSSDPAPEDEGDPGEGKSGVAPSKKALAQAIDALKAATNALEALKEATEDEPAETGSDTSEVDQRDGKGTPSDRMVLKGILRDARKADKIIEKVILRAKEISK